MKAGGTDRARYTILRFSLGWMIGTYLLFLAIGPVAKVGDKVAENVLIAAATGFFAAGYWLRQKTWEPGNQRAAENVTSVRRWTLISAVYLAVFGFALLGTYHISSLSQIIDAFKHPGSAYFYRLRDAQLAPQVPAVQVLTLFAALGTPAVPFLVLFWERLTFAIKVAAIIGVGIYCSYWVAIGTQKGLGDLAVYAAVALLARGAINGKGASRRTKAVIALVSLIFAAYMVYNQADRLGSQGTTGGYKPNAFVAAILGDKIGLGVTTAVGYPTQGYLGLSYNLHTPFVWTDGRGSSRALDAYWTQYVGGTSMLTETYPYRTELRTGWPWDMYWATVYPWLASDLTWYGIPPFMALVGWWLARLWLETIYLRRRLSLLLACQIGIFVAYIPANNQIGITRPGLLAFVSLVALYALSGLNDILGRHMRSQRVLGGQEVGAVASQ